MSTTVLTQNVSPVRGPDTSARPVTLRRTVVAEWIKFRGLRSTLWTLVAMVALLVTVSVLAAWGTTIEMVDAGPGQGNVAQYLSAGYQLAQLAVAALGVLAMGGEYSTGAIRTTLATVPRRWMVLVAKAIVLGGTIAVVTMVSMVGSFVATMPFHATLGLELDFGDSEMVRMLVGLPLYLVAIALLSLAIGALMRHTAGGLTLVIALLLVVENVIALVPLRLFDLVSPFLPMTAGSKMLFDSDTLAAIDSMNTGPSLTPWAGFGVLVAWAVTLLALAMVSLRRRDA
ncbi:ABC transporter permease [Demequina muriae]|uniref:ABC transporter permease subunit n=1 Tax=Demequina muriae TaxID=3051664 RepID=A0ABT8GI43_9MICO|nr:ABC transporter permease subunit [Demequina sp. EGI L300058]MDN4480616.1 ABC transporter permease subunit [Demequina sp. EGI L300058]